MICDKMVARTSPFFILGGAEGFLDGQEFRRMFKCWCLCAVWEINKVGKHAQGLRRFSDPFWLWLVENRLLNVMLINWLQSWLSEWVGWSGPLILLLHYHAEIASHRLATALQYRGKLPLEVFLETLGAPGRGDPSPSKHSLNLRNPHLLPPMRPIIIQLYRFFNKMLKNKVVSGPCV